VLGLFEADQPLASRDQSHETLSCVPVDGFFEWRVIKGQRAKLPYAIAMKDGAPFGLAGIWENWNPRVRRLRTIVTTDANELVADIHDRMPSFFRRGTMCVCSVRGI
jgi:putative SOS response-associated peptidase YedK